MALSRVKTWNAAETLTASDLNAEFNNICNHFGSLDNDDINSTATFTMGELIVGSGITSADGGQLHVHTASAGTIQAVADADEAVFENSAASGITILSGTSSTGMIAFGDSGDADIGKISYSHSTNGYTITANAATALQISSAGAVTTGGSVLSDTDSTDSLGSASVRWANLYVDSIGDTGQALAITAGTNAINLTAGDVTLYDDNNNADTSISMGTSATEALVVQALNGGSNKTLEELRLTTKTASGTADHGKVTVYVDEAHIADVDDSGINLASGKTFRINGTNVVASAGDFSGPGSATDNAVVRFDGTGGKTAQNSGVTIDDSNNATGFANLTLSGELDAATGDFSGDVDVDGTLETDALTIGGTTLLANDSNNRVTTATGSGTLNGEANLTFDGNDLVVNGTDSALLIGCTATDTDQSTYNVVQIGDQSSLVCKDGTSAGTDAYLGHNVYLSSGSWKHTITDEAEYIGMYNGKIVFNTAASASADAAFNGATRMEILSDGDVKINDGDLVIGTSGHGIDFSAHGQASGMTGEVLDDYEEGTWTATLQYASGGGYASYTCTANTGKYVKIGPMVFVTANCQVSNPSASNDSNVGFNMAGLPFTVTNADSCNSRMHFNTSKLTSGIDRMDMSSYAIANTTLVQPLIVKFNDDGWAGPSTNMFYQSSGSVGSFVTGVYYTDS